MHKCAVDGCEQTIADRLLMCPRHWRMVPIEIQRDVYRTFSQIVEGGDVGSGPQRRDLLEAYKKARARAVEAVHKAGARHA